MTAHITRREAGATLLALASAPVLSQPAPVPAPSSTTGPKTFRYAFRAAETGLDPVRLSDLYSHTLTAHLFEALFFYDHLARPARVKPLTAAAMPEVSDDFKTWTIRLRPGILFTDDAAFGGKKRELVAADFVYTLKRFADPANKSPDWSDVEKMGFIGLKAVRDDALKRRLPFDYDRDVPGLQALDRHTLQLRLEESRPRLVEDLADSGAYGAVAREVVEAQGSAISGHPVGTGPYRLKAWRRSSRILLERNPNYRERYYEDEAEPAADDVEGQALLARFKGRRLPMVDEIDVTVIEESQPRWLSFLNGEADFIERVPEDFITVAMPGGKTAPNLVKRGIRGVRTVGPESWMTVYNMEHPVIGGYTPERVALRRAMGLAVDVDREIRLVRRGQAIPAQSPVVPHTTGYDAAFKSEMGDYDPARARALLDMYGYVDRDGDGWREQPNGEPLLIVRRTYSESLQRQLDAMWQKSLKAIGINVRFDVAQWPENLKSAQAGNFMAWTVGSSASKPDGLGALQRLYGPSKGGANLARFQRPELDALYQRMQHLPDGPERLALFQEAKRMAVAWAPYRQHVHRIYTDMVQPWFVGYRRPLFWQRWWHLIDIEDSQPKTA